MSNKASEGVEGSGKGREREVFLFYSGKIYEKIELLDMNFFKYTEI